MPREAELDRLFANPRFPRSQRYPGRWIAENQMGPNALWLAEWLAEAMPLEAGMRVLDLGCGRAMSSIFLAKEWGLKVVAADLWVPPGDNWRRIEAAGVTADVLPMQVEAHALPFAEGYFDAIVSLDAYTYFGTDALYLSYLARFIAPGGRLGIIVPGLVEELDGPLPPALTEPQGDAPPFWSSECWSFHSAPWWQRHWEQSGLVTVEAADTLMDGWKHWARHEHAVAASGYAVLPSEAAAIEADAGDTLALVRVIGTRNDVAIETKPHAWQPAFSALTTELFARRDAHLAETN